MEERKNERIIRSKESETQIQGAEVRRKRDKEREDRNKDNNNKK